MNLVLIGYRGTGKSSVARILAERLAAASVDTDTQIVEWAGRSIAEIFDAEGETGFRRREAEVIAELDPDRPTVIACGGGAVLSEENRRRLRSLGTVVWLRAAAETIHRRVTADAATAEGRPRLTAEGGIEEIVALLAERTPIYRACAELQIDTDDKMPAAVAGEILDRLGMAANGTDSA